MSSLHIIDKATHVQIEPRVLFELGEVQVRDPHHNIVAQASRLRRQELLADCPQSAMVMIFWRSRVTDLLL